MKTIIIITLVIIIILLGIVSPKGGPPTNRAKQDYTRINMDFIETIIDTYKQHTGKLPDKLTDLIDAPAGLESVWQGPYLKESQLCDPWDNPFVYKLNTTDPNSYVITSYGKDGKPEGKNYDADIYND